MTRSAARRAAEAAGPNDCGDPTEEERRNLFGVNSPLATLVSTAPSALHLCNTLPNTTSLVCDSL
eukprot:1098-Pyramimonas_sp.AAC.1